MRVKPIAEIILRGTDEGKASSEIATEIAIALNDEWYSAPKEPWEVVIEK